MGAVQGNLANDRFPSLIHSLGKERVSGVLQLSRDDVEKNVYFGRGSMVFARSSLHSDRLGEFLVKQGKLSRAELALASNKMRAKNEKLGATLVALGLMNERTMHAKVTDQVKDIICSLFSWSDGDFRFNEDLNPIDKDQRVDLATVPILLEGTRKMPPEAVRDALGDLGRVVTSTKDPQVIAHFANLTPEEGFVLSRVDGTASLKDIVSISPLEELATLCCLYGLLSGGFLDLGRKSRAVAPFDERHRQPIEPFRAPESPAPRVHVVAPTTRSPVMEKPTTPSPAAVGDEIEAKLESVASGTFYEWLEIERTASAKDIKKAFAEMIKKYHPDRNGISGLEAQRRLETIVAKITTAYESLSDAEERTRYDSSLPTPTPRSEGRAPEPVSPEPEAIRSMASKRETAEHYYREAKRFYADSDFHEAVKLMEECVQLLPEVARYHRLLAQGLMRNPRWRKSSEQHFKTALRIDRFDAESLAGLAELYESVGLTRRARALYAEAVQIDPANTTWQLKAQTLSD